MAKVNVTVLPTPTVPASAQDIWTGELTKGAAPDEKNPYCPQSTLPSALPTPTRPGIQTVMVSVYGPFLGTAGTVTNVLECCDQLG